MPTKIKSLPKSKNGTRRKTTGFGTFQYQKEELKKEARKKGISVSYLVNIKLFKDWMQ